jgi:hypothetical protein
MELCLDSGPPGDCREFPYHLRGNPPTMFPMARAGHLKEISLGALFAESLEKEASLMPPEQRLEAHFLRRQAEHYRWLYSKIIRVWRETKEPHQEDK